MQVLNEDTLRQILLVCDDKSLKELYLSNSVVRKIVTSVNFWLQKLESVDVLLDFEEGKIDPLVLREVYTIVKQEKNPGTELKNLLSKSVTYQIKTDLQRKLMFIKFEALAYFFEECESILSKYAHKSGKVRLLAGADLELYFKVVDALKYYGIEIEMRQLSAVLANICIERVVAGDIQNYNKLMDLFPDIATSYRVDFFIDAACSVSNNKAMLECILSDERQRYPNLESVTLYVDSEYYDIITMYDPVLITVKKIRKTKQLKPLQLDSVQECESAVVETKQNEAVQQCTVQ